MSWLGAAGNGAGPPAAGACGRPRAGLCLTRGAGPVLMRARAPALRAALQLPKGGPLRQAAPLPATGSALAQWRPSAHVWASVRATVGVGAGLALQAARRRISAATAAEAPTAEELAEALKSLREQAPIVERYLDTALDPWQADYLAMEPVTDESSASPHARETLKQKLDAGDLRELTYVKHQLGNKWLVLATLDVQGAGFVCGTGLAESSEVGEQLAAQQALDRLVLPEDPVAYIKRCADAVSSHEHHAEAREPATQAAEALDGLSLRLRDVRVASFCPCGKAWMAAISTRVFHGTQVLASSADWEEEVAMALAGEVFISRLRWSLRVPPDEPHAPVEWARTWQQRASAKDPWGGVHRRVSGETLQVTLDGRDVEANLGELLGPEEGRYERNTALQAAIRLRSGDAHARGAASAWRPPQAFVPATGFEDESAEEAQPRPEAEPRPYEVTPPDEDPRRKELVGKLPVEQLRDGLGAALETSQVVVISGGTGSGKSTQLPQFMLDDWRGEGTEPQRVVVTQPRRIAAMSVAERVAWERKQKLGEGVGYSVHGSAVRPKSLEGSIEFVTVGTLLRRAVNDPLLQNFHVIVVDEVHERDLLTDFLLILLREVLLRRPSLRLVLMSATIDVETFTNYFDGCPVLEVPTGPLHPVEEVHLDEDYFAEFEQSQALLQAELNDASADAEIDDERPSGARWGGDAAEAPLLDLAEAVIRKEVPHVLKQPEQLSILCFLPGWAEIRQVSERLREGAEAKKMWILPLHSTLPKEQQQKVFQKAPKGKVKVILGTNIAESSVTIDDISVVVDAGLQRELTYDARRRMSSLGTARVSVSSAVQRRGRAGRVREGRVLRLYSQEQLKRAPERPSPEMQRCDLAQSCLQAAALGRDPRGFLAEAPDPPGAEAVEVAMEELLAIDALEEGEPPRLLPVGEVIARLPLEPQLGRAAMLGSLLGLPGPTAALLTVSGGRSPFLQVQGQRDEARAKMKEFCEWSDAFAAAKALLAWEGVREKRGDAAAHTWAKKNMLNPGQLNRFSSDRAQLLRDMRRSGLLSGSLYNSLVDPSDGSTALLENREEMQDVMDMGEASAEEEVVATGEEIEPAWEPLLASVLCMAYPMNTARRMQMSSPFCKTKSVRSAMISPGSVNAVPPQERSSRQARGNESGEGKTWWLYGEMQSVNDKTYLRATTRIQTWHVPVFGGLRVKDIVSARDPVIELDSWISVKGNGERATGLLRSTRREVQDALSWQALAALRGNSSVPARYLERGSALVRCALGMLAGDELDKASLDLVKKWKAPALEEAVENSVPADAGSDDAVHTEPSPAARKPSASATQRSKAAASGQRRGASSTAAAKTAEVEEAAEEQEAPGKQDKESLIADLDSKTVADLKDILRSKGRKVSGRKSELVERCAEALS